MTPPPDAGGERAESRGAGNGVGAAERGAAERGAAERSAAERRAAERRTASATSSTGTTSSTGLGARSSISRGGADTTEAAVRGRALMQALFAASRLVAMWGAENRLAVDALTALAAAARAAARCDDLPQGEAVLRFANEMVYLHDQRLRVDFAGFLSFRHVQDRVARCGIGEIRIAETVHEQELAALLRVLESNPAPAPPPESPGTAGGGARPAEIARFDAVLEMLSAEGVHSISIGPAPKDDDPHGGLASQDVTRAATRAYFRLLHETAKSVAPDGSARGATPRKAKRVVHDLIDVLLREDRTLLALSQVKNYQGFAANHGANVCVLATALALRIGCHKRLAADVGVAAMLHEAIAPPEPAEDGTPRRFDRAADPQLRRGRAARALLVELGFDDAAIRTVTAARDLHCGLTRPDGRAAPLTTRLIEVACFFDTMTSPGGDDWPARSPRETLAAMARDGGVRFDPVLVRVLRAMLGPYPFGTIVELDGGETAIVEARNPHFEQPLRPVVRVLADAEGIETTGGGVIDLSRIDRESRLFLRTITAARAPSEAYAEPADYVKRLGG